MGFGKKRSSRNVGVGAITTNKKKLFAEGGMMDDGKDVDPVSGNDVPVGSLAEEVRDDVDAKLSPGEFVFPADVVRFIGLERLMQMRDQAKKGLMRMNDIGQMGNAEEAGDNADDTYEEEDDDFESDIDEIIKDVSKTETERQTEQAFNVGGFVNPTYYDLTKAPKNPALDIRYFKDSAGKDFYMPFINGKPMKPMPNGAVQTSGPPPKTGTTGGGDGGAGGGAGGAATIIGGTVGGITTGKSDTSGPATQQQQVSDAKDAGASSGISGVYTGENLADFGRADMIYNPGFSGPSGELMGEDLYQGLTQSEVKLATSVGSAIASAMGIPGIATLPARLAINKFGADAYNKWIGERNQALAAMVSGVDVNTPEGKASAASQLDQIIYKNDARAQMPAATSGAIGTGSIAAQASGRVADILKDTGLSDEDIGSLSQRAANAIISGADINLAINNAKTAAVDVIYATKILNGEDVTREQIAKSLFGGQIDVEQPTESGDTMTGDSSSKEGEDFYRSINDSYDTCPAPWTKIMLDDRNIIEAKDLVPGMRVWTQHENTGEWGSYTVSAVSMAKADRSKLSLDDGRELIATVNHRVKTPSGWVEIQNLNAGDNIVQENDFAVVKSVEKYGYGDVVKITVEDAHTYLTEGFLSHNIKKIDQSFDFWGSDTDALFGDFGGFSGGG